MTIKKVVAAALAVSVLSGCAVQSLDRVQGAKLLASSNEKGCYAFSSVKKMQGAGTGAAVGLGVVGGLIPILLPFTVLASVVNSNHEAGKAFSEPVCGLELAPVIQQLLLESHYEMTGAFAQRKDVQMEVAVGFHSKTSPVCTKHNLRILWMTKEPRPEYVESFIACRGDDGTPFVFGQLDLLGSKTPRKNTSPVADKVEPSVSEQKPAATSTPEKPAQDVLKESNATSAQPAPVVR